MRRCLHTNDDPGLVDAFLEIEHRGKSGFLELVSDWGADIARREGFCERRDFHDPAMFERFLGTRQR